MREAVQELRRYCVGVITSNINEHSHLSGLTPRDLQEVCAGLSVDLPLPVALSLPLDDLYWRRRTQAHFPPPHVSLQGRLQRRKGGRGGGERVNTPGGKAGGGGGNKAGVSVSLPPSAAAVPLSRPLPPTTVARGRDAGARRWRQVYVQCHLSRVICATQETRTGWRHLAPLLQVCGKDVSCLHLPCLAPPPPSRGSEEAEAEPGSLSHLDLSEVVAAMPALQELSVRYQSTQEGAGLVWGGVGASVQDLVALASSLTPAITPHLTHLRIHESCIDDTRAERFLAALRGHPSLTCLDLRHNLLTCASAPHLADLLTSCPALRSLNLHHNNIGSDGGITLGSALARRPPLPLEALMMDLNPLGAKGGAALLRGAAASSTEEEDEEGDEAGDTRKWNSEEEEKEVQEEQAAAAAGAAGRRKSGVEEEEEEATTGGGRRGRRKGLRVLSLAGCGLGDECWGPLGAALASSLTYVCLAANNFTQDPPEEVLAVVEGGAGRGGDGSQKKDGRVGKEERDDGDGERDERPRLLLTNLQGSTYLLGRVKGGRSLAPPLQSLQQALKMPLTPVAAREDLAHYLPLHGVRLREDDFSLEEELRGMCLFSKEARQVLKT